MKEREEVCWLAGEVGLACQPLWRVPNMRTDYSTILIALQSELRHMHVIHPLSIFPLHAAAVVVVAEVAVTVVATMCF